MSSIGATTGKEPDHIEDGDLMSPDELRGAIKKLHTAKLSLNQKATIEGCLAEISVVKQQLEMTHEQLRRLIGMYSTLRNEFETFRGQWHKELNVRVGGGSTTPEDMNGHNG